MCDSATLICLKVKMQNPNESALEDLWETSEDRLCWPDTCVGSCFQSASRRLFSIMGMTRGSQLRLSAAKADERRLEKSRHQELDSTREARRLEKSQHHVLDLSREARHARTFARVHAKDASYQARAPAKDLVLYVCVFR